MNENSDSVINVIQNQLFSTGFDKKSKNLEFSNKRLHNQINPAVRDGVVRQEFADLLEKKEYTPETIAQWDKQAMEWILKQGGVYPAGQALLNDKAPVKDAVAELVRRHILNSDVFATAFDLQERIKLNEQHIDLQDWKRGRIIEQDVSIDDLWWNGDDINEWGYDDGKNYADANIPNNRKLLDVITYDDNGNIIPLSQRRSGKNVWLCVFPAEFRSSKISR